MNMKISVRIAILLATGAAIAISCTKQAEFAGEIRRVTFTADDFTLAEDGAPGTKTSLVDGTTSFIWSAADTAGVFPSTGSQIYFTASAGAEASSSMAFDGGGWGLLNTETYYSYYPFIGNIYLNRNRIPVSYMNQKQTGASSSSHIGKCDFMYSKGELQGQSLGFNYHHMSCIIRAKVTLPEGTYTKLAVTAPTNVFVTNGWFDLMADTPGIIGKTLHNQLGIDLESVSSDGSTPFYVFVVSAPVNLKGVEITVSVLNSERKEYQCKKTPSGNYLAGTIGGLTCSTWTEVPQSMGLILEDWGDGGSIGGSAD